MLNVAMVQAAGVFPNNSGFFNADMSPWVQLVNLKRARSRLGKLFDVSMLSGATIRVAHARLNNGFHPDLTVALTVEGYADGPRKYGCGEQAFVHLRCLGH